MILLNITRMYTTTIYAHIQPLIIKHRLKKDLEKLGHAVTKSLDQNTILLDGI